MKYKIVILILLIIAVIEDSSSKELKEKKGFKVPEGAAFVTTIDVNLDKVRDYIVHSPEQITIYNGIDNLVLFNVKLDIINDESFLIDLNTAKFTRPDLVKDLNGNGIIDIPIRGLDATAGEYLKIIDPKSGEKLLETRFAPNSDNLFIYDVDGNDTLDVVIERLDSVLIFSSTVVIPNSINYKLTPSFLATLESFPNPTSQNSTIVWKQLGGKQGESAFAVIIDMQGQEIRRIRTEMKENSAIFEWDGKGWDSSYVPSGVYLVKATSGGLMKDAAIVVSR